MDHGTKIADICYEYFEAEQKMHRTIGSLFYFRNHSGGCPSAQLRLDVIPSVAWAANPDTWFIGNYIESEKVPECPYVCGQIYVPSDKRGERTYIGHVGTYQTPDGDRNQFRMQLFGVPLREIKKGIRKSIEDFADKFALDNPDHMYTASEMGALIATAIDSNKKHSLYLGIELEG